MNFFAYVAFGFALIALIALGTDYPKRESLMAAGIFALIGVIIIAVSAWLDRRSAKRRADAAQSAPAPDDPITRDRGW